MKLHFNFATIQCEVSDNIGYELRLNRDWSDIPSDQQNNRRAQKINQRNFIPKSFDDIPPNVKYNVICYLGDNDVNLEDMRFYYMSAFNECKVTYSKCY